MQITRNTLETTPGPSDWFTGAVFIDTIAAARPLGAAEGVGYCQKQGGAIEVIRPAPPLRTGREPLARRRTDSPDDAHRDPDGRRVRQPVHLGRARQRRGLRQSTRERRVRRH